MFVYVVYVTNEDGKTIIKSVHMNMNSARLAADNIRNQYFSDDECEEGEWTECTRPYGVEFYYSDYDLLCIAVEKTEVID